MLIIFLSCVAIEAKAPDPTKLESWAITERGIANNQQSTLIPFAMPELQKNGVFTGIGQSGGRNFLVIFNMNTKELLYTNMDQYKAPEEHDPTAITYTGSCTFKRHSSWDTTLQEN